MGKPVNDITGDAPDGQNPEKKYVPPKEGKWKFAPSPPPKPNPKDAGVFTEEMLQRSGGKMKEPPYDPEGKKRGGSIKRRYARGGEIMDVEPVNETEASDKAAGLKASKGEDVGFFKRLSMGNIDQPGSEAYEKFGAGRGKVANIPAAAERQAIKREPDEGFKPEPVENKPAAKPPSYADRGEDLPPEGNRSIYNADYTTPNKVLANLAKTKTKSIVAPKVTAASHWNKSEEEGTVASPVPTPERYKIPGDYKEVRRVNRLNRLLGMPADDVTEEELRKEEFRKKTGMAGGGKVKKYAGGGSIKETEKETGRYPKDTGIETDIYPRGTGKETFLVDNPDIMKRGTKPPIVGELANLDSRAVRDRKTAQILIAQDEKYAKSLRPQERPQERNPNARGDYKRGGGVKAYAKGGSVSASSRGDGCAQRGKTRGTMR